jgi:hypothetical protein
VPLRRREVPGTSTKARVASLQVAIPAKVSFFFSPISFIFVSSSFSLGFCFRFSLARYLLSGAYVLMEEKLPKYVVPDLTNCKVRGLQSLVGRIFVQVSLFVACVWISIIFWVANLHKN